MDYDKPHLSFEQQVAHLQERGLDIADTELAAAMLRRVGYYRLSAYAYPLRRLLPSGAVPATSVQFREDRFVDDAGLDLVIGLWEFDRELRLLLLDAVETIEIGLRVQVSYVLGRRDPFGYLNRDSLDAEACARADRTGAPTWENWVARYLATQQEAESEDFVRHYVEKYDGHLPIWVSTEIMEFGPLVRLYGLMLAADRSEIARALGATSGTVVHRWLKTVNYVRNIAAHHARLWNRRLTYSIARPSTTGPAGLVHLRELGDAERRKIYAAAAVIAHLVRAIDPDSDWPRRFAALARRFPPSELVSPEHDMGFAPGWADEVLWR